MINGNGLCFLILLLSLSINLTNVQGLRCDYKEIGDEEETDMLCTPQSKFCFALWKPSRTVDDESGAGLSNDTAEGDDEFSSSNGVEGGAVIFLKQGCWEASPKSACESNSCTTNSIRGSKRENLFCCCDQDNCNSVVSLVEIDKPPPQLSSGFEDEDEFSHPGPNLRNSSLIYIILIFGSVVVVLVIIAFALWWRKNTKQNLKCKVDHVEAGQQLLEPPGSDNSKNWEVSGPVHLGDEIARGKFGTVYTGKSAGTKVALKLYNLDQKEFYENEKYIYQLLERCHGESSGDEETKHVIRYYGYYNDYNPHLILVLQRITPGTLRDVLGVEGATMSLPDTIKMMKGIAKGLSFLHGDNKDGIIIAHRDMTSKNILVDENFTPYLSDFGLSLRINGSKYYFGGEEHLAELNGLAEAGTQRYMAPELLDGAVNLKDCENALKQMDIYALALILWEIGNMCPEIRLIGGGQEQDIKYVLPYELEIGKEVSKESLTRFVVTRRDRPSFTQWRDTQITRSLHDTLNESWDPEPDARLTALCIVERLHDLSLVVNLGKSSSSSSTTPLELNNTASSWIGRNSCLERNLLHDDDEKSNQFLIIQSEKHKYGGAFYGNNSSTEGESVVTERTEVSNGESDGGRRLTVMSGPNSIPILHNNISRN